MNDREQVKNFWEMAACGEHLLLTARDLEGFRQHADERYRLEPYIDKFADFDAWRNRDVLEIGLGIGADHVRFAVGGAHLSGIDLTDRAVELTRTRLDILALSSDLRQGDAESLPYDDDSFDLVYSWGVIHHIPDTARAAREILRVLRPGGEFRVMVYHTWSLVGLMLWLRYALLRGRPFTALSTIYARHLESPGTKAYTKREAAMLFPGAERMRIGIELTHGDLLDSRAGQRHEGRLLDFARRIWPRWLLRRIAEPCGLFMLISGRKAVR